MSSPFFLPSPLVEEVDNMGKEVGLRIEFTAHLCLILSCIETDQTMQQDDGIEQLEAREKLPITLFPAILSKISVQCSETLSPVSKVRMDLNFSATTFWKAHACHFGRNSGHSVMVFILAFSHLSILSNTMCGTHSTHTPQPTTQNTALHARTHQFPSSACNDEQQITMPRNCSLQPPSWHGEVMTKNSRDPCLAIGTTLSRYLFKTGPENENPPNKKTLTRP